jgi:acyl dehydratase
MRLLGQRVFSFTDQERFAAATGDCNPMHMDALKARRTQAGAPVVHGIHMLLWAIDALASAEPELQAIRSIRAQFHSFVYLGEQVEATVTKLEKSRVRFSLNVGEAARVKVALELGEVQDSANLDEISQHDFAAVKDPVELDFNATANCAGRFRFPMQAEDAATLFPNAARWIGIDRVRALAATTYLVGMVCPGLHSIYSELSLKACKDSEGSGQLAFRVIDTDARFHSVEQQIAGGGFAGSVVGFVRRPPVTQASMEHLRSIVGSAEFAGSLALIIGGSRGLGELTAKAIAAGGGRTIISYVRGKADAERVANEIRASGGSCDIMCYDAGISAAEQLAALTEAPSHVYYFATPAIFRPALGVFDEGRFDEFLAIYVRGFWSLVKELHARRPDISCFYPSSIAVTERPEGMTEYAMAKTAGEALCADINASWLPAHVTVRRLPRMPTDQTASVTQVEEADPVETMLPIVREVQSFPK